MYVAVTRVSAPKPALERMAAAFRQAMPDLRKVPGCLGFELWLSDTTLEAVSKWESKEAVQGYANSPLFTSHHGGSSQGGQGSSSGGPGGGQVEYYEGEVLF